MTIRATMAQNTQQDRVPRLPEQMITVRAKGRAVVYTMQGARIPADNWVAVPVSPGVIRAIQAGDLEEGKAVEHAQHGGRHRRHDATE